MLIERNINKLLLVILLFTACNAMGQSNYDICINYSDIVKNREIKFGGIDTLKLNYHLFFTEGFKMDSVNICSYHDDNQTVLEMYLESSGAIGYAGHVNLGKVSENFIVGISLNGGKRVYLEMSEKYQYARIRKEEGKINVEFCKNFPVFD